MKNMLKKNVSLKNGEALFRWKINTRYVSHKILGKCLVKKCQWVTGNATLILKIIISTLVSISFSNTFLATKSGENLWHN